MESTQPSLAASKERFFRYFQHEVTALQEQMERLTTMSLSGGERNDAVDHCLAGIDRLSHEVKDASTYVPAYDQRTYSQAIKALSEKLQTVRATFDPPKKFSFKTRKNASAISINDAAELAKTQRLSAPVLTSDTSNTNSSFAPTPLDKLSPGEEKTQREALKVVEEEKDGIDDGPGIRRPSFSTANKVLISNHKDFHVVLPASASSATSSGTLSNLSHSVIDLSAASTPGSGSPFSALYIKDISDCVIICGHVAGALHVTNASNSVIVATVRQWRMHASTSVDVYLHCASRPIIEDCKELRFAPLPGAYLISDLASATNNWNQIDDFKWLKPEPSPNFSILPEDQRIEDRVWKENVQNSGEREDSLEDVLKVVLRR